MPTEKGKKKRKVFVIAIIMQSSGLYCHKIFQGLQELQGYVDTLD